MDADLDSMDRAALLNEVKRLRQAIREHRDASGHDLCWHHPRLWSMLPEPVQPHIEVPEWPQFLRGCLAYRQSLDQQAADAPRITAEYGR
ncbi:hypothetical protein [Sandaracinobacteroides saxicola]|uniref:Uncharacterized protein n=1 Tax=Sandaracinobacteroides saxicola TaxID=2759707 RepID=A0A7G5IFA3_9SPHN|nr:hypothetical protein [Sandaracinobacteroides saxicola]QMW22045.1 hypothetical protein H3309_11785 [Sandaracinobacteroides saxicola]